jgi:hypothetical protein
MLPLSPVQTALEFSQEPSETKRHLSHLQTMRQETKNPLQETLGEGTRTNKDIDYRKTMHPLSQGTST